MRREGSSGDQRWSGAQGFSGILWLNDPPAQLKHRPCDGTLERFKSTHQKLGKIHQRELPEASQEYVSNSNIPYSFLNFYI